MKRELLKKTKKMFMLASCIAMMLAISTGCEDEPMPIISIPPLLETLEGTKWKFVGFYDAETNTAKEVEKLSAYGSIIVFLTKNMEERVWAIHRMSSAYLSSTDSVFFGNTHFAEFPLLHLIGTVGGLDAMAFYKIDYSSSKMKTALFDWNPLVGLGGDMALYSNKMNLVQSFSFSNEKLKLYYNDEKNYLLFERCYLSFEFEGEVF